jgi:hypothetical protein
MRVRGQRWGFAGIEVIRTTGMERVSTKLRNYAKDAPRNAAAAVRNAADDSFVAELRQWMEDENHNWKGSISKSIKARAVKNTQFYSVVVTLGSDNTKSPSKLVRQSVDAYWSNFVNGGNHGDWPLKRLIEWIKEKDKVDEKLAARRARRAIKTLEEFGAVNLSSEIENVIQSSQNEFHNRLRDNLRGFMNPFGTVKMNKIEEVPE